MACIRRIDRILAVVDFIRAAGVDRTACFGPGQPVYKTARFLAGIGDVVLNGNNAFVVSFFFPVQNNLEFCPRIFTAALDEIDQQRLNRRIRPGVAQAVKVIRLDELNIVLIVGRRDLGTVRTACKGR